MSAYLLLGALAGLGWWTNPLIAAALLTSLLLFVGTLRWNVFSRRSLFGLSGFIVGSAPFWLWNSRHAWQSLDVINSVSKHSVSEGVYFLGEKLVNLLSGGREQKLVAYSITALFIVGLAHGLFLLCSRSHYAGKQRVYLGSAFMFILISAILFVRSEFASYNTVRYLTPIIPVLGVILGSTMSSKRTRLWSMVLIGLIVVSQIRVIAQVTEKAAANAEGIQRVRQLRDALDEQGLDSAYAPFHLYSFNFYTDEEIRITDFRGERYAPLAQYVEQSDRVAVLRNFGDVRSFVHQSRGTCQYAQRGIHATYAFSAPKNSLEEQRIAHISRLTADDRIQPLNELCDRNVATAWRIHMGLKQEESLVLSLERPTEVSALRITSQHPDAQPQYIQLQFRSHQGAEWESVDRESAVTGYFWSGPRPYWQGAHWRMELRFNPLVAEEIKVVGRCRTRQQEWEMSECQVFSTRSTLPDDTTFLPDLVEKIKTLNIRALYCDRWVANKVHEIFKGTVLTSLEPDIFPDLPKLSTNVETTQGGALLVRKDQASTTEWALNERGTSTEKVDIGPWILYTFNASQASAQRNEAPALHWTGLGCFVNMPQ
jgi:hypothetical protein